MEKRLKKATIVIAIVAGVLILLAVVLGVLNALVADGAWQIGWKDYRYNEDGYEIGEGSIVSDSITGIDLDWIDGEVEIVACQDTFVSISERADGELRVGKGALEGFGGRYAEHQISEILLVFGLGSSNREKKLTLRIPERFFDAMNTVRVEGSSCDVVAVDLRADTFVFEAASGSLSVKNCEFDRFLSDTNSGDLLAEGLQAREIDTESKRGKTDLTLSAIPAVLEASAVSGDVILRLSKDASFVLEWETESGNLSYDIPLTLSGEHYVCGDGASRFEVETKSGDLTLVALK